MYHHPHHREIIALISLVVYIGRRPDHRPFWTMAPRPDFFPLQTAREEGRRQGWGLFSGWIVSVGALPGRPRNARARERARSYTRDWGGGSLGSRCLDGEDEDQDEMR
jgi:hypothetical protein